MNWTHTSTAAVAAKKSGAPNTAKIRKTVINVIVHIFLAILAFIWVLPIFWVILTSFRGEKGSYVSTFFPKTYTFNNYIKLFTDTSILNFPKMFMNTFVIAIFTCIISTIFVLFPSSGEFFAIICIFQVNKKTNDSMYNNQYICLFVEIHLF